LAGAFRLFGVGKRVLRKAHCVNDLPRVWCDRLSIVSRSPLSERRPAGLPSEAPVKGRVRPTAKAARPGTPKLTRPKATCPVCGGTAWVHRLALKVPPIRVGYGVCCGKKGIPVTWYVVEGELLSALMGVADEGTAAALRLVLVALRTRTQKALDELDRLLAMAEGKNQTREVEQLASRLVGRDAPAAAGVRYRARDVPVYRTTRTVSRDLTNT